MASGISAPNDPIPPLPSANSALRCRDGNRPCGRSAIAATSAAPKTRMRYSEKPRSRSGSQAMRKAPNITPGMLPDPPRTTAARIVAERMNGKSSGEMKIALPAYMPPARPPIIAPVAKANSLNLNVGTPISSAASSSSRMAAHARPTRLWCRRTEKMITNTIRKTIRT